MKKRKILWILLFSFLSANCFGCSVLEELDFEKVQTQETATQDSQNAATEVQTPSESVPPAVAEEKTVTEAIEADVEEQPNYEEVLTQQQGNYAFSCLTGKEQLIYAQMVWVIENFQSDQEIATLDSAQADKIYRCIMMDHPEYFWLDGYSLTKYSIGNELKRVTFTGEYNTTSDEADWRQDLIDTTVNGFLATVPSGSDEYTKVKMVYEYIITNTDYDAEAPDNQNISSVFINKESVCQGYAFATHYLLERLGIPTITVSGVVTTGETHAWNIVLIDGNYYYVDTTWGDPNYTIGNVTKEDAAVREATNLSYDYLCVTTEQISVTHQPDSPVNLPKCVSMEANYYVREGIYFTAYNAEQLSAAFNSAVSSGKTYVTLKCQDATVFYEMKRHLIDSGELFQFISSGEEVMYMINEEQTTITIFL